MSQLNLFGGFTPPPVAAPSRPPPPPVEELVADEAPPDVLHPESPSVAGLPERLAAKLEGDPRVFLAQPGVVQPPSRYVICPATATGSMDAEDVALDTWTAAAADMARSTQRAVDLYLVVDDGRWVKVSRATPDGAGGVRVAS